MTWAKEQQRHVQKHAATEEKRRLVAQAKKNLVIPNADKIEAVSSQQPPLPRPVLSETVGSRRGSRLFILSSDRRCQQELGVARPTTLETWDPSTERDWEDRWESTAETMSRYDAVDAWRREERRQFVE